MNFKLRKYLKYLLIMSIFLILKNLDKNNLVLQSSADANRSSNASQFFTLLQKYNSFKFKIDAIHKNNNLTISEEENFLLINKILFENKVCLIDKNVLERLNKDLNNVELKKFYESQKYSSKYTISYGLDVEQLENFFKVKK